MSSRFCLLCRICHEPVSLKLDTVTDENGKAVHEDCYVKEITGQDDPAAEVARILSLRRLA
jgi:hypothetical protein